MNFMSEAIKSSGMQGYLLLHVFANPHSQTNMTEKTLTKSALDLLLTLFTVTYDLIYSSAKAYF